MLIRMTDIKIFETPLSASNSVCILMLNNSNCSINAVLLLEQCNLLHLNDVLMTYDLSFIKTPTFLT